MSKNVRNRAFKRQVLSIILTFDRHLLRLNSYKIPFLKYKSTDIKQGADKIRGPSDQNKFG